MRSAIPRSGITLTEILIAILIMGVGMVSVATLFPLGMLRMRDAVRDSRSTLLAESAVAEVQARDLLNGPSFVDSRLPWYTAWSTAGLNPLSADINRPGSENPTVYPAANSGIRTPTPFAPGGPGLWVAYDPLFWANTHFTTSLDTAAIQDTPLTCDIADATRPSGRFASGIGFLRPDPTDGGSPSAHGLQRLTNFAPYISTIQWPLTYQLSDIAYGGTGPDPQIADVAGDVFTSLDDIVFQPEGDAASGAGTNPVVPYSFGGSYARDYEFSWMLTLRQAAAGDTSTYEGDIVLFHKRPLGFTTATGVFPPYAGQSIRVPEGERVVEAVWGFTSSPSALTANPGYSQGDDRVVLLRWHLNSPDPAVKVGSYIADVTYERTLAATASRYGLTGQYPGQRCHWYRVTQVSPPEADPAITSAPMRRMIVRVDSPVRAKTRLTVSAGNVVPVHVEAALINSYVVNVVPVLLYSR